MNEGAYIASAVDAAGTADAADSVGATGTAGPPDRRLAAMSGIRALLLDMDGVVVLKGAPLPGAAEAIRELSRRGTPFRVLTNSSLWSRDSLSGLLSRPESRSSPPRSSPRSPPALR